jgi:hypothetical protein
MIIKTLQYMRLMIFCLLLTSCNFLKSEHFPGKPINIEDKDIGKEMAWKLNKDKVYKTVILDKNLIKAGNLEWNKEQETFYAVNHNIILSKLGNNYFINIEDRDGMYRILKFTISSDSTVVAYTVDKDKMDNYINDGKLKAEIVDGNIILDLTKIELNNFIDKYDNEIFNYDNPFVFQKIYEKAPEKQQQ